jgi:hypothetical protein
LNPRGQRAVRYERTELPDCSHPAIKNINYYTHFVLPI